MSATARPRAVVYVDGFNLYYLCVRGTPYKWLNLESFCQAALPQFDVARVNYYTAKVSGRANDPDAPRRQAVYLRAIRTLPRVQTTFGLFRSFPRWMQLVTPPAGGLGKARVWKTEEKGSDVNLAAHLIRDAFRGGFDAFVVLSNDSDLCEPIRIVRSDLMKSVAILHSVPSLAREIRRLSVPYHQFTYQHLQQHQLPDTLTDGQGQLTRPLKWQYALVGPRQAALGSQASLEVWRYAPAIQAEAGVIAGSWDSSQTPGVTVQMPAGHDRVQVTVGIPASATPGRHIVEFSWSGTAVSAELDIV